MPTDSLALKYPSFFWAIRADQRIKRPVDKWPVSWSLSGTPNAAQEHPHAAARTAATAKFSLNRKSRSPLFGPFPLELSHTFLVDCVGSPTHYLPRIAYLNCEPKWASPQVARLHCKWPGHTLSVFTAKGTHAKSILVTKKTSKMVLSRRNPPAGPVRSSIF